MSRIPSLAIAAAVLLLAAASPAAEERAVVLTFTPTERAEIAIWIEAADGTFRSTVGLTQAVSVHGIGNRPGAAQMNSGYRWPYGRREGVLPVWAHRRAGAPGALPFPRIIFQQRPEGYASRTCSQDSTPDSYFCLSFSAESTRRDGLDATTCASTFNSDKGRILTPADVAAGYSEPVAVGGPPVWQLADRPLSVASLYPPRRDFTSCANPSTVDFCMGGSNACLDHPDSATYVDLSRAAMPEIDAVTMATPPGDREQTVMFSVPPSWPDGDYVAYLEINTEGDYNASFNADTAPTPCAPWDTCPRKDVWDSWAVGFGYPYRGQPSVVFAVPFVLGAAAQFSTMRPVGFGSLDGTDPDAGAMHAMDASISDDPQGAPGSGADRLRIGATQTSRLELEVRPCLTNAPPDAPTDLSAAPVTDAKHSHEWAHLHFVVPADRSGISRYEVRTSTDPHPIVPGDDTSFIQGLPGQAASSKTEALVIPVGQPTGAAVDVDFGGLSPLTHYWVGVRAVDSCNRAGPHAVVELTTTKVSFTQLPAVSLDPSHPQCFVATAAWGSAMEPTVLAMRRARDRLLAEVPLFAAAADLYSRSGPAAARVLRRSDTARTLTRQLLSPLGTAVEAVVP